MKINIETVENGVIITQLDDELEVVEKFVLQKDPSSEKEEAEQIQEILRYLTELLAYKSNHRYSSHRVYTIIRPGDKHPAFSDEDSDAIWGGSDE